MILKTLKIKNLVFYILGIFFLSLGIVFSLVSDLGAGSWDALNSNLSYATGISIGTLIIIIGSFLVIFSGILLKKFPNILSFITNFFVGLMVDLWLATIPSVNTLNYQILYLVIGIALLPLGVALLVISKFPPTPIDVFFLSIKERFNLSIKKAKLYTELIALSSALIIGFFGGAGLGDVYLGTFIITIAVGELLEIYLKLFRNYLKIS